MDMSRSSWVEPSAEQIEERLPVWESLSEFFLDTELQPDDHERIARTLAATRFGIDELDSILIGEVCPVCKWNLLAIAGEWAGFDSGWLKEKLTPYYGKRPRLRFLYVIRHRWMYERQWRKIRARISAIRGQ